MKAERYFFLTKKFTIMKKLTSITLIALGLFLFSACKKEDDSIKKDDSKTQIAVKMQLKPFDYSEPVKGESEKTINAIVIGEKGKLKALLLRNNGFRLQRTSKKYPTYLITGSGVVETTTPLQPCMNLDGIPCPVPPPKPPCTEENFNNWIQENMIQWQAEANSTCETTKYYFNKICKGPDFGLPIAFVYTVSPSLKSGCWTLPDGVHHIDKAYKMIYNPTPVPSTHFDTASLIKEVYSN